jgi:uncharacterized protein
LSRVTPSAARSIFPRMPDPTTTGKVAYIEIPALDVQLSSRFYSNIFGWRIRTRTDGVTAFDDTTGEISGTWVTGRPPSSEPGVLIYIMVAAVTEAVKTIVEHGGSIVTPVDESAPQVTATFRDPAGNVFGLRQERRSTARRT